MFRSMASLFEVGFGWKVCGLAPKQKKNKEGGREGQRRKRRGEGDNRQPILRNKGEINLTKPQFSKCLLPSHLLPLLYRCVDRQKLSSPTYTHGHDVRLVRPAVLPMQPTYPLFRPEAAFLRLSMSSNWFCSRSFRCMIWRALVT